jgi:hypothetical protein
VWNKLYGFREREKLGMKRVPFWKRKFKADTSRVLIRCAVIVKIGKNILGVLPSRKKSNAIPLASHGGPQGYDV